MFSPDRRCSSLTEREVFRRALLRKCRGPHARPADQLVALAISAARRVMADYRRHALVQLAAIEAIAPDGQSGCPEKFQHAVMELRSSAAMANEKWISAYAGLLERLLRQADEQSRDFHRSLPLFLGALHLALCRSTEEGELHALHNSLTALLHHACGAEAVS